MIVKRTILVALGLLLLAGPVIAADLSASTISDSTGWLIANDGSGATPTTSTFTVHVIDGGPPLTDVNKARVDFSLADPTLGTISPASVETAADGLATTTFTVSSKSGNVTINAVITYDDGAINTYSLSTYQNIDHEVAHFAYYEYPVQVPVGSITSLTITLLDRYANRVDDKNAAEVHMVHLSGLGSGGSGFWDGSMFVSPIDIPADAEGNISADMRVSTVAGYNKVAVAGIGDIPDKTPISIEGVSVDEPATITQLYPTPPRWPADALHTFNLYYTVMDTYGNPLDGAKVLIDSSAGESFLATTANGGVVHVIYGPKNVVGTYTITAKTEKNSSVLCTDTGTTGYCSQSVVYYSQAPVDMILTASSQTLESLDVNPDSQSTLQARVVDVAGNPVSGQTVTFEEGPEILNSPGAPSGGYIETAESYLDPGPSPITAVTDENGLATVTFIPGEFPTSGDDYNRAATGMKTVTAHWTNPATGTDIPSTVTFTWKNYPYLTVITQIDKTSAKIGEYLRVTIIAKGDGEALKPKPVDVLLLLDNSGSMGTTSDANSRLSQSKIAAIRFIDKMEQGKDRVGVIFYDKKTSPHFSVYVIPLTGILQDAKDAINSYTRTDTKGYHTRTRYALYEAISAMNSGTHNPNAVRAIIHMTDGDWSMEGDPLARGIGYDLPFGSDEGTGTGLHSIWAGNVVGVEDKYRYFSDLGGGTAVSGSRNDVPDGQKCDNGRIPSDGACNGWISDNYEGTQRLTTKSVTYYTDAKFTNQNMSEYAKSSNIRVYSISYGGSVSEASIRVLNIISNSTGGYYKPASDSAALNALYTEIAGDLNEEAGGSTALNLNMGTITVDGIPGIDSYKYLNYTAIPVGGRTIGNGQSTDSTYVDMFHTNKDGSITDYYNYTRDDSQNWTETKRDLNFDIGTMKLDDTWKTSFVFNLTYNGTIVLFGPGSGSSITFTDSSTGDTQTVQLDEKKVSVYKEVNEGLSTKSLVVDNLAFVNTPDPGIWTIQWNTLYTGDSVAQEYVQYRSSEPGSQWTLLPQQIPDKLPSTDPIPDSLQIDTRSWTPGATYTIMVTAKAANKDASPSSASVYKMIETTSGKTFIRLE